MKGFFIFLLALLLVSCKAVGEKSNIRNPEMVLNQAVYVINDKDGPIRVSADKIEIWVMENKKVIEHFNFIQTSHDSDDVTRMSGKADYAQMLGNSNQIDMKGDVEMTLYVDDNINSIHSSDLKLDTESGEVSVSGEFDLDWSSLKIKGSGLSGNIKRGRFRFDKVIDGRL